MDDNKQKALQAALTQIERQYGKGSVMRLGDDPKNGEAIDVVSTGSIGLDAALGVGGLPQGRVVEIYGPESSGKTTLTLESIAQAQKKGLTCAFIDAEHALDPQYAKRLGVDIDNLLVSQPDTGEQALEIVDMLVRSAAVGMIVIDLFPGDLLEIIDPEGKQQQKHTGLDRSDLPCEQTAGHKIKASAKGIGPDHRNQKQPDRRSQQGHQINLRTALCVRVALVCDKRIGRKRQHFIEHKQGEQIARHCHAHRAKQSNGKTDIETCLVALAIAAHISD